MYLRDVLAVVVRRWPITLAGVVMTALLCFGAYTVVSPTYKSTAELVLLPPKTSVENGGNPLLALGGLGQASDVLIRSLTSDSEHERIGAAVGTDKYEIVPDWTTSSPILVITAHGADTAQTDRLMAALLAATPATLGTLQDTLDVPSQSRISSMVLTQGGAPVAEIKNQVRAVLAAAVVGLGLTVLVVVWSTPCSARGNIAGSHPRRNRTQSPQA